MAHAFNFAVFILVFIGLPLCYTISMHDIRRHKSLWTIILFFILLHLSGLLLQNDGPDLKGGICSTTGIIGILTTYCVKFLKYGTKKTLPVLKFLWLLLFVLCYCYTWHHYTSYTSNLDQLIFAGFNTSLSSWLTRKLMFGYLALLYLICLLTYKEKKRANIRT